MRRHLVNRRRRMNLFVYRRRVVWLSWPAASTTTTTSNANFKFKPILRAAERQTPRKITSPGISNNANRETDGAWLACRPCYWRTDNDDQLRDKRDAFGRSSVGRISRSGTTDDPSGAARLKRHKATATARWDRPGAVGGVLLRDVFVVGHPGSTSSYAVVRRRPRVAPVPTDRLNRAKPPLCASLIERRMKADNAGADWMDSGDRKTNSATMRTKRTHIKEIIMCICFFVRTTCNVCVKLLYGFAVTY